MYLAVASLSSSAGSSGNSYIVAFIAVIGAIVGAAIAAITQAMTTRISSKNQLASLKMQLEHQTQESIRQERRRAYARYLHAMYRWETAALEVYAKRPRKRKKLDESDFSGYWNEYLDSLHEVDLLAGDRVSKLAHTLMKNCSDDIEVALRGENPDRGNPIGEFPVTLTAAMQEDLGVTGGFVLDPETGLRIWE